MYVYYKKALEMMGKQPIKAIVEEAKELSEVNNLEEFRGEFSDVLHATLRACRTPAIISYAIARKCAVKHAKRVMNYGCPRSRRNCLSQGVNCCCKGNSIHQQSA
jgi:hypothetical protein